MKKLTAVSIASILCMMVIPTMAQAANMTSGGADEKVYTHMPFSLSFVPGISTSGFMGGDITTNCSINIIAGRYARLRGVEFGSVLNWETEEVYGAQFSGVANIVEGNVQGFQAAGTVNAVLGNLHGLQTAGAVNYVGGHAQIGQLSGAVNVALRDLKGVQMSGAANYVGGDMQGYQTSGAINYVGGSIQGFQASGALNVTLGRTNGAQIGVVNISRDVLGAQIGVVNIARKVEGAQVGVINLADEHNGAPIGIFSFVRKGQIHLDVWASDTSAANIALKTGSKHVYSILAVGHQPSFGDDPYRWSPGIGIGGHIPFGSKYINVEALSFHINEDEAWTNDLHMVNKLRLIGGWQVDPRFSIFAGLTLNVFVSRFNDGDHIAVASLYDRRKDSSWIRIWPGFVAGVQF